MRRQQIIQICVWRGCPQLQRVTRGRWPLAPADYEPVPTALRGYKTGVVLYAQLSDRTAEGTRGRASCAADGVGPVDVLRAHVAQDACGAVWESGVAPLASD